MPELITSNLPIKASQSASLILNGFGSTYLKPLFITSHPIVADDTKYNNHNVFPERDNTETLLGKPVIAKITLESDPYEIETFNDKTKSFDRAKINGSKIELETVLADVQMAKNIVTTPIDGMNGTVKEYISDGDYLVTLRGAVVNPKGNAFPTTEFNKLRSIVKAPISVKITSDFLTLFSIHYVTVTDYSFPQKEGYTNTQLFEINCLSDNAIDVIKINK